MNESNDYLRQVRAWERFNSEFSHGADRIRRAFDESDREKLEEGLRVIKDLLAEVVKAGERAERDAREAERRELKMLLVTVVGVLVAIAALIATIVLAVA